MKIADYTNGYDAKTVVVRDAEIQIDVFHFWDDETELSQYSTSLVGEDVDIAATAKGPVPQGKVLSIPSRRLDGFWDGWAGLRCRSWEPLALTITSLIFETRIQYLLLGYVIRRSQIWSR